MEQSSRRRLEDQIRKLSRAVEASPVSVVITDRGGIIEYVNPFFTKITGYSFEETVGKTPRILKSGLTPKEIYPVMWKTILAGCTWHGEFINKKKDGELYNELAMIAPITNEQGEITHFVAIKQDITERRKIEDALAESIQRYDELTARIPVGVYRVRYTTSGEQKYDYISQRACNMLGINQEAVLADPDLITRLICPEDIDSFFCFLTRLVQKTEF